MSISIIDDTYIVVDINCIWFKPFFYRFNLNHKCLKCIIKNNNGEDWLLLCGSDLECNLLM